MCRDTGLQGRGRAVKGRACFPVMHTAGQRVGAGTQGGGVQAPSGHLEVQLGPPAVVGVGEKAGGQGRASPAKP